MEYLERFPSKPYIMDGFPKNATVLVNSTTSLSCPLLSDLEPYIRWYAMEVGNETDWKNLPTDKLIQVRSLIRFDLR